MYYAIGIFQSNIWVANWMTRRLQDSMKLANWKNVPIIKLLFLSSKLTFYIWLYESAAGSLTSTSGLTSLFYIGICQQGAPEGDQEVLVAFM
jgi:hypothetical protein